MAIDEKLVSITLARKNRTNNLYTPHNAYNLNFTLQKEDI